MALFWTPNEPTPAAQPRQPIIECTAHVIECLCPTHNALWDETINATINGG